MLDIQETSGVTLNLERLRYQSPNDFYYLKGYIQALLDQNQYQELKETLANKSKPAGSTDT